MLHHHSGRPGNLREFHSILPNLRKYVLVVGLSVVYWGVEALDPKARVRRQHPVMSKLPLDETPIDRHLDRKNIKLCNF